jgi:hypothetical protein
MSDPASTARLKLVTGAPDSLLERLYAADTWRARSLEVPAARGTVSFASITQPWLKEAAKSWARQRLLLGQAFNTVRSAALAFKRFSGFLSSCGPPVQAPGEISRSVIEGYLAYLAAQPLSEGTKALSRIFLRASWRTTVATASHPRSPWTPSSTTTRSAPGATPGPGSCPKRSWHK